MPLTHFSYDHLSADGTGRLPFFGNERAAAAIAAAERAGIPEGLPLIWTDSWELDVAATVFSLHVAQRHLSQETRDTYAQEMDVFARFLAAQRLREVSDAIEEDFWAYRSRRLHGPLDERVSRRTWNKIAAVLQRYIRVSARFPPLNWRRFRGGRERCDAIRMVPIEDYYRFRDLGLAQLRNPLRNCAFADFAVTTGIRIQENGGYLRREIPRATHFGKQLSVELEVPETIAKGAVARRVYLSKKVAHDRLDPYISEERTHYVRRAIDRDFPRKDYSVAALNGFSDFIFFEAEGSTKARVVSGPARKNLIPFTKFTLSERRRMVEVQPTTPGRFKPVDLGPLWISEGGACLTKSGWNSVFESAGEQCASDDALPLDVTPHMLRHTFAVTFLNYAIQGIIKLRDRQNGHSGDAARQLGTHR